MDQIIKILKQNWKLGDKQYRLPTDLDIQLFEKKNKVLIPGDLKQYFKHLNGNGDGYDDLFYLFYPLSDFENIDKKLKHRTGSPNYSNLINTFKDHQDYYVFCDFEFHLFAYAIHLSNVPAEQNEVYVLCGDEYKLVANSFTAFLNLYIDHSDDLIL